MSKKYDSPNHYISKISNIAKYRKLMIGDELKRIK